MNTRRSMLRSFIAEQYREHTLHAAMTAAADGPLAGSTPAAQVRAALVPLLLPHLVEAVEHIIVGADDMPKVRAFAGGLLTYVFNPLDLIPDDGPLGWLDDAVVCALGLRRLTEAGSVELDQHTDAVCELVLESLPSISADLREAIERFVADLWESGTDIPPTK